MGNQDWMTMSRHERDVLKVMAGVLKGDRSQVEAARLLDLSVRQGRRIQRRLEKEGGAGGVHRARGQPSNRRLAADLRQKALTECRRRLLGFGPTLASEKLAESDIEVSP